MAGNIPGTGGSALPGTFVQVETQSRGSTVPGGIRVTAIIGEGSTQETIVTAALGGGQDGLDPTYSTVTGADGRHFALSLFPIISNRTQLFRNGIPLVGTEGTITTTTVVPGGFDYQLDIASGHILLSQAHLVDQGGTFWQASNSNVGVGVINGLTLVDVNAPQENWTIKCISVQRNGMNQPIAGTAIFVAFGTISGNLLDANGNPIVWVANNQVVSNGILKFSIQETASTPFREGDSFLVEVSSGVLNKNDTLTSSYIPVGNLNDPLFVQSMTQVAGQFGLASQDNNLSLGCQLAFANSSPGIMCVQAAPPLPRRTSYLLSNSVPATSLNDDDFLFAFPPGVVPELNTAIHFFVKNNTTNVETQVLPNMFPFYTLGLAGKPTVHQFIFDNTIAPGGNSFSYSLIQNFDVVAQGLDGYITDDLTFGALHGIFNSSINFDSTYVGKVLNIIDSNDVANIGQFLINSVVGGKLHVQLLQPISLSNDPPTIPATLTPATVFPDFVSSGTTPPGQTTPEPALETFELIDTTTGLVVPGSNGTDGTLTALLSTGTATLHSTTVNFNTFGPGLLGLQLKISGSVYNNGVYVISAYNSGTNTLTIAKTITTDFDVRYEILDTTTGATNTLVINHNVVPNGFSLRVTIVDTRDATFFDTGWINALASLEKVECDILVPLPKQTITAIFQNSLIHCQTMSNLKNKKERVLFIGAINGLTPDNVTGAKLAAVEDIGVLEGIQGNTVAEILAGDTEDLANYSVSDAYGNTFRVVYFYPDQIVVQAGANNILIDGFYLAAAAGGYLSGVNNIAMPLTAKVLSGFTILRNKQFSPFTLEQLANSGITTLQPVAGGGTVVWGITTSQSGFTEEREISIVFIRDRIAKSLRGGFNGFIGMPEDDTMVAKLSGRAQAILNSFISQGLITAFKDLLVVRDSVDPTQWNITVRVQPTYPVNFIFIKVSIGLL